MLADLAALSCAIFSWRKWSEKLSLDEEFLEALGHCAPAPAGIVDEFNRRTRALCKGYFVTQSGKTKQAWFELGEEPDDSWDKAHGRKQIG